MLHIFAGIRAGEVKLAQRLQTMAEGHWTLTVTMLDGPEDTEALTQKVFHGRPDVLVLQEQSTGVGDAFLDTVSFIKRHLPDLPVVTIESYENTLNTMDVVNSGVNAFFPAVFQDSFFFQVAQKLGQRYVALKNYHRLVLDLQSANEQLSFLLAEESQQVAQLERELMMNRGLRTTDLKEASNVADLNQFRKKTKQKNMKFSEAKKQITSDFEIEYLTQMLHLFSGNVSAAAKASGIERSNLLRLLRKYKLSTEVFRKAA